MKDYREPADRAVQFSAFDALKGYDELVERQKRIPVSRPELCEEEAEKINRVLLRIKKDTVVSVRYFEKDRFLDLRGPVREIVPALGFVKIGKTVIRFEQICRIFCR